MKKKEIAFLFLLLMGALNASDQDRVNGPTATSSDFTDFTVETVVEGIKIPWGMAFLPDGGMLVTEKAGEIFHVQNGNKTNVEGVPKVVADGQGGLLDIILHPDYSSNGWLYISYSSPEGQGNGANTAITRARLEDNKLVDIEVIYKAEPNSSRTHHYGSRMVFDKQGFLYFSIGERGDHFVNPQDITKDMGKVYRVKADGTIPEDNPFYGQSGAKAAIYSYGHRNPQGMIVHPETGDIWVNEHGPRGGDEINVVKKGANYGWPVISYGINYDGTVLTEETEKAGMEQPLYYWAPSIAPSGFALVDSDKYPALKGTLLVGSLKFRYLEVLYLENNQVTKREKLLEGMGRVRDVRMGPDGLIYVSIEGKGIVKLVPKR